MASFRDINDLAKDPARARMMADGLLHMWNADWSEWERDFLEDMAARQSKEPLTTRQAEKLFELREDTEYFTGSVFRRWSKLVGWPGWTSARTTRPSLIISGQDPGRPSAGVRCSACWPALES